MYDSDGVIVAKKKWNAGTKLVGAVLSRNGIFFF